MREEGPKVIVVIDDDEAARISIGQMLRLRGYQVELFDSAEAALAWPGLGNADCVMTDVRMPGMDGEEFLEHTTRRGLVAPVVMVTGHGDIRMAVRCLKAGAYDFVEKPFEDDVLLASVGRAVEKTSLRRETNELRRRLESLSSEEDGRFGMVGRSREMEDVYEQIEVAAGSAAPVVIVGETGVGKELVARAIHAQGCRSKEPFVPVNAGALSETMLQSELFGHRRGAFTGAELDRKGKLVLASGGTILLDEVESLSERAQVQLLRVLEDGIVEPLGSDSTLKVDVRLLTTTKTNLQDEVQKGRMREDFYHRIMVFTICVPPLRERVEDIPLLISHFLKDIAGRKGSPVPDIPEGTLASMLRHSWPGNVRELKHALDRMMLTSHEGLAGSFELDGSFASSRLLSLPTTEGWLRTEMERTERTVIDAVLRQHKGEISATAQALGISRRALYERMKKYMLEKEGYKG